MNCANHPEAPAVAFCRTCGKPLCQVCQRPAQGTIFCEEHVAAAAPAAATTATAPPPPPPSSTPPGTGYSPYTSPYTATDPAVSPGLAFLLGLIPGVGAIYNGQYAKGIVHVLIFGTLISIISTGAAAGGFEPLIGLMIGLMFPYMAFEAYHTARKRQRGEPIDEFSSLLPSRGPGSGFPIGPILLILLGVLFLLNTLDVIRFYQIMRWWPVFLIVLGGYLLYMRVAPSRARGASTQEAPYER
jgi:TM2 domain-containing membrane protein YozV